ncbi:hypothetical protein PENSPDRAFT_672065 [Peniophora sp. CONT]|nr:hypothetical protein PENSPDRAFT_672065 [Peniophora sp. CONT]
MRELADVIAERTGASQPHIDFRLEPGFETPLRQHHCKRSRGSKIGEFHTQSLEIYQSLGESDIHMPVDCSSAFDDACALRVTHQTRGGLRPTAAKPNGGAQEGGPGLYLYPTIAETVYKVQVTAFAVYTRQDVPRFLLRSEHIGQHPTEDHRVGTLNARRRRWCWLFCSSFNFKRDSRIQEICAASIGTVDAVYSSCLRRGFFGPFSHGRLDLRELSRKKSKGLARRLTSMHTGNCIREEHDGGSTVWVQGYVAKWYKVQAMDSDSNTAGSPDKLGCSAGILYDPALSLKHFLTMSWVLSTEMPGAYGHIGCRVWGGFYLHYGGGPTSETVERPGYDPLFPARSGTKVVYGYLYTGQMNRTIQLGRGTEHLLSWKTRRCRPIQPTLIWPVYSTAELPAAASTLLYTCTALPAHSVTPLAFGSLPQLPWAHPLGSRSTTTAKAGRLPMYYTMVRLQCLIRGQNVDGIISYSWENNNLAKVLGSRSMDGVTARAYEAFLHQRVHRSPANEARQWAYQT